MSLISSTINSKFLILGVVIATVFTMSLTENLQSVDGFSVLSKNLIYELNVGEKQMLTWGLINEKSTTLHLEMFATGPGSELLTFEKNIVLKPNMMKEAEIFVIIPKDHPDNIEYRPSIFVKERSMNVSVSEGAQINMILQMTTTLKIKIGNNPIFTSEVIKDSLEIPIDAPKDKVLNTQETSDLEIPPTETMEEKLARIQASNDLTKEDTPVVVTTSTEKPEIVIAQETESIIDVVPICGDETTENARGVCVPIKENSKSSKGGGCLIATAAYGTELAPQVQFLREIRDNTVMSTGIGASFMESFNQVYYSFSPYIADMERENPMFQEAVRVFITPMVSTLSIMTLAENGSEGQVLGLGLSVMMLNFGMYIAAPAFIGIKSYKHFKSRN